MLNKQILNI